MRSTTEAAAAKPSWNLEAGAEIAEGRTVLEPLGGGRRYEVILVWEERLLAPAVAKILRPNRVDDERAVRALRREAALLRRLEHPILVRGLDAVLDGRYPHLLLELVDGRNMRTSIKESVTLPVEDVLPVAVDLLAALHYLAVNGVVHLDVKPSNVVLSDSVRLIDMGTARPLGELAARRTPIGTASYMSPEQCDPTSELGPIGPPADVWGAGATLYHALTGNRPFSSPGPPGSDPVMRYPQLVERPLPIPDYVPEPVARVIMATLAHDPGDRPTAVEAAKALEPLVEESVAA
jgi:serine/threonine protein kinase